MQKGSAQLFVIITIILVTSTIGYFIYKDSLNKSLISPASELPENILTYKNNLGFEIKYDKNFEIKEETEEDFNKRENGEFRKNFKYYISYEPAKFLGAVNILGEEKNYQTNPFSLWIFENPDNLTIDSWYKKYWYYPFVWGDFTQRNKNVAPVSIATISGQLAKSGVVEYKEGNPKFIYLSKDQKMYLFRIVDNMGEEILEGFKFIN